jgi:competence protein ComEC
VRHDSPAAIPLIGFVAGLSVAPYLVNPWTSAFALVWSAVATATAFKAAARAAALQTFIALGILSALYTHHQRQQELRAFAAFDEEQFVKVVAPLERDWATSGSSFLLRAETFVANGKAFREPITIYARFEPPQMQLESAIECEGLLRRNERGYYTLTLKSPRLMAYAGEVRGPARWNRLVANRLRPHVARHPTEVALIEALVLGRGERLTDDVRNSFKRGGTYHLLVFSGLQIAFAAAFLAALLRWLHAPRASDWLLLAFSVAAPLFIGQTASVSRSSIGIGLYAVARILKRPTSLENLWCVAALLRLAIEPRDLTDVSFHLTYAGAGALLFIARHRRWILRAMAAELAITPLTLFHFHQFAIGGSLLTLAMSPLIFAMLVVSIAACALPCDALFATIALLHRVCAAMNVAAYSGFFTAPSTAAMIVGFGLALVALTLREHRAIVMAAALSIPLIAAVVQFRSARVTEAPRVTFFDVGQGDSIAIRDGAHTILVDGGGRVEDGRFGETRLLPLLLDRGIRRLDVVVLTHAHPDHCGGLPAVVEHLRVGEVWISPRRFRGNCAQRFLEACRTTATPIRLLRDGETRTVGHARITTFIADRTFRRSPENNASVVLRVALAKRTILLTGDIEREAEVYFLDRMQHADVLKVAHHGSRSSSMNVFLDTVAPRIAVISCGRRNLFGHPHAAVLESLAARRVRVWRTDRSGTVDIELTAPGPLTVRGEIDTLPEDAYR